MLIKGQRPQSPFWTNLLSIISKGILFLRNQLTKKNNYLPPAKSSLKKTTLIVLITIFLWTFFASYMIYRNTPGQIASALAELIGMQVRKNKKKTKEALKAVTLAPLRWITSRFPGKNLPQVYIDIKFKHFRKLQEKRKESLKKGVLITGNDDYVPAKIRYEGRTIKVNLRLKGDRLDHLEGEKWSFRVHVKDDDHLFGLRRFSFQNPSRRGYDAEILFYEALKREGILAPKHFFADFTINGKKIGIMAIEEHFSKELLESQGRRAGVIIKFDETLMWAEESMMLPELEIFRQRGRVFDSYKNAPIKPFRMNRIKRSPKLTNQLEVATGLLRAFVNGTLKPSQVFDPDLMGRFIAVSDFWTSWHQLQWHNLRFYFNAITGYLEPIGFDAEIHYNSRPDRDPTNHPIITQILDESIRKVYIKTFERLRKETEDGGTARWAIPLTTKNIQVLHKEFPYIEGINLAIINQWTKEKLKSIKGRNSLYPQILQAYLIKSDKGYLLELHNPLSYDVIVSDIKLVNSPTIEPIEFHLEELPSFPIKISRTEKGQLPTIKKFYFQKNNLPVESQFLITANIKGNDKFQTFKSIPYFSNAKTPFVLQSTLTETLDQHPFLTVNHEKNILSVQPGQWQVESWLVVPEDFELILTEGTILNFSASAGLISRGPVTINGTEEKPVVFKGKPNAENSYWQGVIVLKSKHPSNWSHVQIKNTKGIKNNGWEVTSGVTFYESDAYLHSVTFSGNRCEDALNIVRSTFQLTNVKIINAISDGFDADFSNGTVTGGLFKNLGYAGGGDGIDLSGSQVSITGTRFFNISDKAISVGENSNMKSNRLSIQTVGVGIASKDGSRVLVENSKITQAKLAGLMAYIKKSEYPSAEINANNVFFMGTKTEALAQNGNKILLNDSLVKQSDFNINNLYQTSMKPGLK